MPKKILLVKPVSNYYYTVAPNLGLGYLASSLRREGHSVEILDCDKNKMDLRAFEKYTRNADHDIVGFQLYTPSLFSVREQTRFIKRHMKEAIVVVGGPHASGDPVHTLQFLPDADIAVIGEGEKAIVDIALLKRDEVSDPSRMGRIENIAYRDTDGCAHICQIGSLRDLDDIPPPAWDLIDPRSYPVAPHGIFLRAFPAAPVITTRGCPYSCTFCASHKIHGRKIRMRNPEAVIDEIALLNKAYNVREIHIEDDNFTMDKEYASKVLEGIIRRRIKIWIALPNGVRIDSLDRELLSLMERSGCYSFGIGIESGSDRILKAMKKSLSTDVIAAKTEFIKKHTRIRITGFFLMGHPDETEEDILKTIDFALKLKLDRVSFSPVMPLPGSEIYDGWKKKIYHCDDIWNKFLHYQFVPSLSPIDVRRLEALQKEANARFYLRPRIILGILGEIKSLYQLKVVFSRAIKILFG